MKVILVARNAFAAYFDEFRRAPPETVRIGERVQGRVAGRSAVSTALACAGVADPDDDAIRSLEVGDRRALAQELGVRDDVDLQVRSRLATDAFDLVAGADRHRRLGDDHERAKGRPRHLGGGRIDIGQVGVPIAAPRRRADGDEGDLDVGDRAPQVRRERQAPVAHVALDKFLQPGLVDRHDAVVQSGDLARVAVDANDVVSEIGEAGPGDKPDIARTDHGDAHDVESSQKAATSHVPASELKHMVRVSSRVAASPASRSKSAIVRSIAERGGEAFQRKTAP